MRGPDQIIDTTEKSINIGGFWICDFCGDNYYPNQYMPEISNGMHICKSCTAKAAIEYFDINNYSYNGDIEYFGKKYRVSCVEIKTRTKRPSVSKKDREKVLLIGECLSCGNKNDLQVDHIIPVSKGGTSHISNLQPLCGKCNREKAAKIQ